MTVPTQAPSPHSSGAIRSGAPPVPGAASPYRSGVPDSATRHLAAGAYLDAEFRRTSLREVFHQAMRMVAPSYGFDLGTVLFHCVRARNIALARDAALITVLFFTVISSPMVFFLAVALMWSAYFGVEAWRIVRDAARRLHGGDSVDVNAVIMKMGLLILRFIVSQFVFMMIAFFVMYLSSGSDPYAVDTGPASSEEDGGLYFAATVVVLLLLYGVVIAANLAAEAQLATLVPHGSFAVAPSTGRYAEIRYQQHGNQVVYSGYWPFVGSGSSIGGWSFAQRLMGTSNLFHNGTPEAQREFVIPPFTAQQLIDTIRDNLRSLASQADPERLLPGLTVEDKVFVAGTEISHLVPTVEPQHVWDVVRFPTAPRRHYLVCQVVPWRGELVTTVYVHIAVQGKMLYVELATTALPPCDPRFRVVDQVNGTGAVAYLRAVGKGLLHTPREVAGAAGNLVRSAVDMTIGALAVVNSDRAVATGYDHGARVSVRELGSTGEFRNHQQTLEVEKYQQLIERRVLAVILDFLDAHGVDTAELTERSVNILNAGAVNIGGTQYNSGPNIGSNSGPVPGRTPSRPGATQ
jgi:hypothetical protein